MFISRTTEEEFYDNKIRVNGRIPKKKALQVCYLKNTNFLLFIKEKMWRKYVP